MNTNHHIQTPTPFDTHPVTQDEPPSALFSQLHIPYDYDSPGLCARFPFHTPTHIIFMAAVSPRTFPHTARTSLSPHPCDIILRIYGIAVTHLQPV